MTDGPSGVGRTANVIGAGLIGGSVGLALRERGWQVAISDVDVDTARRAVSLGAGRAVRTVPAPTAGAPNSMGVRSPSPKMRASLWVWGTKPGVLPPPNWPSRDSSDSRRWTAMSATFTWSSSTPSPLTPSSIMIRQKGQAVAMRHTRRSWRHGPGNESTCA